MQSPYKKITTLYLPEISAWNCIFSETDFILSCSFLKVNVPKIANKKRFRLKNLIADFA